LPAPHLGCYDARSLEARRMNTTRLTLARRASFRAARPMALGIGGAAGRRVAGIGPAPI